MMVFSSIALRLLSVTLTSLLLLYAQMSLANQNQDEQEKLLKKNQRTGQTLDPIVVSATRTMSTLSRTPATISVITSEALHEQQANNLREALRYQAGISVQRSTYRPRNATQGQGLGNGDTGVVIRGLGGNRVLMIEDGIRMPSAFSFGPFNAGRANYSSMDMLSRIEILRGPASTLYGSDGLAGAISLTTKTPQELLAIHQKPYYFSVHPSYDSSDRSFGSSISVAGGNDRVQAMLITDLRRGHETESRGDINTGNYTRTTADPQNTYSASYLGKVVAKLSTNDTLTFTGESVQSHGNANVLSAIGGRVGRATTWGLQTRNRLQRDRISIDYVHEDEHNPYFQKAQVLVFYQNGEQEDHSLEERGSTAAQARPVIRGNHYQEKMWGGMGLLESHFQTGPLNHELVYGVEGSTDLVSGLRTGNTKDFPNQPFPGTDYVLLGAFLQDQIRFGRLSIVPGVRLDYYRLTPTQNNPYYVGEASKSHDFSISPRIAFMLDYGAAFKPYLQYAHGFRAPSPDQVNNGFSNPSHYYVTISNPNLKPEKSNTVELGAKGNVALPYGRLRYSGAAYYGRYIDFINLGQIKNSPDYPPGFTVFQYMNADSAKIYGLEFSGDWVMPNGWSLQSAVAYTKGTMRQQGQSIPLDTVMPLSVVLGLRYEPTEKWFVQSDLTMQLGKDRDDMNPTKSCTATGYPNEKVCFAPPTSVVLDIRGGYTINKNAKLYLGVYNVFNRKYWTWSGLSNVANSSAIDAFSAPGRSVAVSLKIDY